jgi:hypothetical protein
MEEDDRYVVIEGNRRLAAVKALLDPEEIPGRSKNIPKISYKQREELRTLPTVLSDREEAWRYLGFKHVNGPAKWSSYAKARYIAEVHQIYGIPLREITRQIGDRHKTVQRLFRGLMVIEQAEREKVYDRENRYRTRFAFSHLYIGLDYDGISDFLSLRPEDAESKSPVPDHHIKELGELCTWLYGDKRENKLPVVESQNPHLRQLSAVLESREAVAALRANRNLSVAVELSRSSTAVFEEALFAARRELQKAHAYLTVGYSNSEELLRTAGTVANLADDLYREMERKLNPEKEPRLTEG